MAKRREFMYVVVVDADWTEIRGFDKFEDARIHAEMLIEEDFLSSDQVEIWEAHPYQRVTQMKYVWSNIND